MERKRSERRIITFLVMLLSVEVALLGLHLGWGGFHWNSRPSGAEIAGHVSRSENELRRRGNNSLVWEKTGADDEVYFYDSILTLAQSTASLKLFHDTEVKLSENTLVTIEPQDKRGANGEIRLKFIKGSLKARNPFVTTKVESDSWSMEIKSGSEVDFRQVGETGFELEVTKGEVDFKSAQGETKVAGLEMLKIKNDVTEKITIDEELRWVHQPPPRIYTHRDGEPVKLEWQSEAHELVVQTLGRPEQVIPLEGRSSHDLELPLGRHQIFLRNQQKTSPALSVEVWKAPLLHLVSPLPRNRIRLNEKTSFVWMTSPDVKSYAFVLKGANLNVHDAVEQNSLTTAFGHEDDAEWSVEGKDADGFTIPPLYTYPIYIREAPLAAPKLRAPMLRKPAKAEDRGAFYWFHILPEAQADEILYQAVFEWEKVEGADRYVIEISEAPDFRKPLVNKTVDSNEFVWKRMELKTYYWRVAAETKGGRLGIFSDPEKADLQNGDQIGVAVTPLEAPRQIAPAPKPHREPPVIAAKAAEPKPEPPPPEPAPEPQPTPQPKITFGAEPPVEKVEKAPEPVNLKQAPAPPPVEKIALNPNTFIEWTPSYSMLNVKAPDNVRAGLNGANPFAFGIGADRVFVPGQMAKLQLNFVRYLYKPQPAAEYPDQKNLNWNEIIFTGVIHKSFTHWGYGVYAKRGAEVVRESPTSLQINVSNEIGVCVQGVYSFGRLRYTGDYIGMIGSDYGLTTRQALRFSIFNGFYSGLELNGAILFRTGARTNSTNALGLFGYDF